MQELTTQAEVDAVLEAARAVLLKHGAYCPISASARRELAALAAEHPELTITSLEVTAHRALSDGVADRLGVPHQSPQLFLLRDGAVAWQATHYEITAGAVAAHLGR